MGMKDLIPFKRREETFLEPFDSIDKAFEDLFAFPDIGTEKIQAPAVDIKETEKEIIVSADLPGIDKKDIKLDLTGNSLSISCERKEEKEEKDKGGYRMKETRYGKFYRAFALPAAIKEKETKAVYRNGVLKITMQKQKQNDSRRISIE